VASGVDEFGLLEEVEVGCSVGGLGRGGRVW
jgi:hypothetical protein